MTENRAKESNLIKTVKRFAKQTKPVELSYCKHLDETARNMGYKNFTDLKRKN